MIAQYNSYVLRNTMLYRTIMTMLLITFAQAMYVKTNFDNRKAPYFRVSDISDLDSQTGLLSQQSVYCLEKKLTIIK